VERLKPRGSRDRHPRTDGPPPPPRQRRAFSTLGGPVELGGEAEAARTLGLSSRYALYRLMKKHAIDADAPIG